MDNTLDTQTILMFAAIALLAYWFFSQKPELFESAKSLFGGGQQPIPVPHVHLTEEEAAVLQVRPPPPEEIPQYAQAFTL